MNGYLGVSVFFLCILAIIIKSHSFQNLSVKVIIMADQAIISFCHTLVKEIGGLSSVMETQAVFKDICPSFGNIKFWIKSIDRTPGV